MIFSLYGTFVHSRVSKFFAKFMERRDLKYRKDTVSVRENVRKLHMKETDFKWDTQNNIQSHSNRVHAKSN